MLINRVKLFNPTAVSLKHALTAVIFVCLGFAAGCGKRKPPLPPVERVAQTVEISGTQIGNQITLVWQMPARNAGRTSALNISRADVYRLAEPLDAPLSLTEEEFASNSTLIASIPLTDSDFSLKEKQYSDTLQFSGQPARLRYAIRFVNASGQKAAFSNFFLIEPTSKIAMRPESLTGLVAQEAITLSWIAPDKNEDGSVPPNILGYNVYRITDDLSEVKKLNNSPIPSTTFADNFFEFDTRYSYSVRTVSLGGGGLPIESAASNVLTITPIDTFPPSPPSAITIAASPNAISIFFATNVETDVTGYRIYRTTDSGIQKDDWELLTPSPLLTNTFQDTKVRPGNTYFYYLTAIDRYGNVSEPSETISETAF